MSFSSKVFQEIVEESPGSRKEAAAGLSAIVECIGRFYQGKDGECHLILRSGRREPLTKTFTLLRKTYNISVESAPETSENAVNSAGKGKESSLSEYEFSGDPAEKIRGLVGSVSLADEKCIRSFLAHQFLCIGTVHDPLRDYYLAFETISEKQAGQLEKLLAGYGIVLHRSERSHHTVLMTRDSAVIADVLNLIGTHVSLMELENARIMRQVRGRVNRSVNCETSNIRKTAVASSRQLEEIQALQKSTVWQSIPESLREIAVLREEYPESSLQELGNMLNPPIGKSGVNHRLRRLSAIAESLQKGE